MRRDDIGDLEAAVFDGLAEAHELSRRLELVSRTNRTVALALADARGREGERLLSALLDAEHPAGRKGKAKGKAQKGTNGRRRP